jgi:hypothetical protein
MKIVVTYEAADITRLIRQDLAQQGITASEDDIKFTKNKAVVSVEVSRDDNTPATPEALGAAAFNAPPPPALPTGPKLEAIDGGNAPMDMSEIHRASAKAAATNPGKFPVPERQLMDGESFDFPGGKR